MDTVVVMMISIAAFVVFLLIFAMYLLYTIRKLLFRIAGVLDSIDKNSSTVPFILKNNPHLWQVTETLGALNRELKRYMKRFM